MIVMWLGDEANRGLALWPMQLQPLHVVWQRAV